jgi:predicted amidohydrolase
MPDMKFSIAVAQMDCVVGETEPNLSKIEQFAETAAGLDAQLVIFPECAATGYFVGDKITSLAGPPDGPTSKALGEIARSADLQLAAALLARRQMPGDVPQGAPVRGGAELLQRG